MAATLPENPILNSEVSDVTTRIGAVEVAATGVESVGNSGSALTLNASSVGYVKRITFTANCTLTLTGANATGVTSLELELKQDATGSRLVTWPAAVKWAAGSAPTLTTTANAVDRVRLKTYNGGTTWYADLLGKAYA